MEQKIDCIGCVSFEILKSKDRALAKSAYQLIYVIRMKLYLIETSKSS